MARRDDAPRHIGEVLREHNIRLATKDPVALGGFTQVPNFILNDPTLTLGAKVAYAKFLQYAGTTITASRARIGWRARSE